MTNGKHTIKINFLPLLPARDKINPTDFHKGDFGWAMRLYNFEYYGQEGMDYKTGEELYRFVFDTLPAPVPYYEQQWEIEINDLPYELEGWRHSIDLSQLDPTALEKEVVAYYMMMRDLLHQGKAGDYQIKRNKRYKEMSVYLYQTPIEAYQNAVENFNELNTKCPGNMLPIENYRMVVCGNGKLVYLERTDDYLKGMGALLYDYDDAYTSLKFMLHKPKGSDTLEPIR